MAFSTTIRGARRVPKLIRQIHTSRRISKPMSLNQGATSSAANFSPVAAGMFPGAEAKSEIPTQTPQPASQHVSKHKPKIKLTDADRIEIMDKIGMRENNCGLQGDFYTDDIFFQNDLENIWYKEWVFVGNECELAKPGDWISLQIGVYPIVVVRGKDNIIRAFHNSCRHRGYKLCEGLSGSEKRHFKCPYHQWTYKLDGQLHFARDYNKEPGFDKAKHSLKEVSIKTSGGYMFLSLADNPEPFEPVEKILDEYLEPFDLSNAKVAYQSKIVENGNWKMVWENNRECYHCKGSHDELVTTFPDGHWWNGVNCSPEEQAVVDQVKHYSKKHNLPSDFKSFDDFQMRTLRIPLTDNAKSFTMTGDSAMTSDKRLGRMPIDDPVGDLLLYHYPSTWNHFLADHALSFRILPISPTETEVTTTWMVPKDAVEGVDYNLEDLTHVWLQTNAQDKDLVERNQAGVSSPAYEPGPMHSQHEVGVIQFLDWYTGSLLKRMTAS